MGCGISQTKKHKNIAKGKQGKGVSKKYDFTHKKRQIHAKEDRAIQDNPPKTTKKANSPHSLASRRMSYLQENNYVDDTTEQYSLPLPVPQEISVVVTPASVSSNENFQDDEVELCQEHNSKCQLWCEKCKKPVCNKCILSVHTLGNGHNFCKFEQAQIHLQNILIESQLKLDTLISKLKPLQAEVLQYHQKEEEMAHELILAKKRSCTKIILIGEQISKAVDCLERWSVINTNKPFAIYQAILQQKKSLDILQEYPSILKEVLESYSLQCCLQIQVQNGPVTCKEIKKLNNSSEDDIKSKLQKFIFMEALNLCLLNQMEYNDCDSKLDVIININYNSQKDKNILENKTLSDKEFIKRMKIYLKEITNYNCQYKALMFFDVFHIHLNNVTQMVDALMEMALSSSEHCSSLSNFCVHFLNASIKKAEYQFISKSLPLFLLSRCQNEFLKDIYDLQIEIDLVNLAYYSDPISNENDHLYNRYKCLIRFIGELYVCGLMKFSFLDFFIENLMSRQNNYAQHYEYVCILLFTVGATLDMETETNTILTNYFISLENKLYSYSNSYIKNLFQYLKDLRNCQWNIRELSYSINSPPPKNESEVADYLNSVEALAVALNQAVGI